MRYRLPTDEEWSFAVGLPPEEGATPAEKNGKDSVSFPWGKDYPPKATSGNYADSAWHEKFPKESWIEGYADGYATTSPVGSFSANAFGLYDMGGNVWQWCEDWFDASQRLRVLRGASWIYDDPSYLRSSFRWHEPSWATLLPLRVSLRLGRRFPRGNATRPPEDGRGMDEAEATKKVSSVNGPPFENSLGMLFLPVPITGGPTAGRKVMFSVWDTRVRDYEVFARETKREMEDAGFPQGADHPVVKVSRDDAHAFCAWLTARERASGELPETHAYRLPSDHEWSCAAGIGDLEDALASPEEKTLKIANPHAESDEGGGFRCVLAPVIATVLAGDSSAP